MRRAERIAALLRAALDPERIEVSDDSAAHHGHAGFDVDGSHFHVTLISARFSGQSRPARHRLVYDALASMFPDEIHALTLQLRAPGEVTGATEARTQRRR